MMMHIMMMPKILLFCIALVAALRLSAQNAVVANDKMNVFYAGVENPISVAVAGVASENVIIEGSGAGIEIKPTAVAGKYIVKVSQFGETTLTLKDKKTGKVYAAEKYRCKRIPDPVVTLGGWAETVFSSGKMKAQLGLIAQATGFDIDMSFDVQSYTFYYKSRTESISLQGKGSRFTGEIAAAISRARPGDSYSFTDIKVRCPGDVVARNANSITIDIK